MVALVGLVCLVGHKADLVAQVATFSGTTIGLFALANAVLATAKWPCVVGMSAILATSIIFASFAKTVTEVTIIGPVFAVALLATVVAAELQAKYWQVLLSLLAEGTAIIALCRCGDILFGK